MSHGKSTPSLLRRGHGGRLRRGSACSGHEQKFVADATGKCDAYDDFRRLLDRQDIDAVVVSTPHHWHTLVTVAACQAGKDVYCEKPLALTIAEDRAIVTAAREHGRIVQTGSQQRSGRLGQLRWIEVGLPKSVF